MSKIIHTLQSPDKSEFDKRVNLFLRLGCDLLERSYEVITNDDGVVKYSQVIVFNNNCEVEFHENGELKSFVKNNKIGKNGISVKCGFDGMFEEIEAFKNGERDIITNEDGSQYEGEFKNGKYDGFGAFRFSKQSGTFGGDESESYVGDYKDGEFNGKGVHTLYSDSEWTPLEDPSDVHVPIVHFKDEGEFKDGKLHGWGKHSDLSEPDLYDEGEFKDGVLQGQGERFYDGYLYIGSFKNGIEHGEGKLSELGDLFYEGSFKDGKFDGRGRFFTTDGTQYEGKFVEGEFFGNGTITFPDGKIEKVNMYNKGKELSPY